MAWELSTTYPKLYFKEIRVSPKIRVLPSETAPDSGLKFRKLPQTLDLNFATASRWCGRQNSSTVELSDHTDDGRAHHGTVAG